MLTILHLHNKCLSGKFLLTHKKMYRKTKRARSGSVLTADRMVPRPAGGSVYGDLEAVAPGQAGRLRPSNARARGA